MPLLATIECPFVQRAAKRAPPSIRYHSEFDVVADGMLVLDDTHLSIYEYREYKQSGTGATARLVIPYAAADRIQGRKIISEYKTYQAGRLRFFGIFEQARGYERITLKLHPDAFKKAADLLTSHLGD
jgi:hypothetical protein